LAAERRSKLITSNQIFSEWKRIIQGPHRNSRPPSIDLSVNSRSSGRFQP
jgi:hypothetical protein